MRIFDKDRKLVRMICNQCGAATEVSGGLLKKEFISVDKTWGYFSEKDLEIHSFDLCEPCYDRLRQCFALPPEIIRKTEVLGYEGQ